jgi:hypothetical protein
MEGSNGIRLIVKKGTYTSSPAILPIGNRSRISPAQRRSSKFDRSTITGGTVLNQDFREFIES